MRIFNKLKILNIIEWHVGFTIAEVLITLGIIGVVAQMTIPSIVSNAEDTAMVSRLYKAYSTLSSAYAFAVQENGSPEGWGLTATDSPVGAVNMLNALAPYMKIEKNCGNSTGCFPFVYYKRLQGTNYERYDTVPRRAKAMLADGTLITTLVTAGNCDDDFGGTKALDWTCGWITVDLNGDKGPNTAGMDDFQFILTRYGIVPSGSVNETKEPFETKCKLKTDGFGCTAWVLYNKNRDYLYVQDLSWASKLHK